MKILLQDNGCPGPYPRSISRVHVSSVACFASSLGDVDYYYYYYCNDYNSLKYFFLIISKRQEETDAEMQQTENNVNKKALLME
jgi:hypothetical protein